MIALQIQHLKNELEDQGNQTEVGVEEVEEVVTGTMTGVDTEDVVAEEEVIGIMREEEDIEAEAVGIATMIAVTDGIKKALGEAALMLSATEETLMAGI